MKRTLMISFFIILLFIGIVLFWVYQNFRVQAYHRGMYYMDTYIEVNIYSTPSKRVEEVLEEVEKIYQDYHELTDRYHAYPNVHNLYDIYHNQSNDSTMTLDSRLYALLSYAKTWYETSNHLLNVNIGSLVDVWKKYRDLGSGIPTMEELKDTGTYDMDEIVLLSDNKIKNTHPNIDLGAIAKGYVTEKVSQYLKEQGFTKFLINAGGNVVLGGHYKGGNYKIGIQDPMRPSNILEVVKGNHMSVVTSGGYERYYTYEGVRYHHILDIKTKFPAQYMESVTVITKDGALGDTLSTILFLMPVEEGLEWLKQFPDTYALWYCNDGTIVKSEGFEVYE